MAGDAKDFGLEMRLQATKTHYTNYYNNLIARE